MRTASRFIRKYHSATITIKAKRWLVRVYRHIIDAIIYASTNIEMGLSNVLELGDPLFEFGDTKIPVYCNNIAHTIIGTPRNIPNAIATVDTNYKPIIVINSELLSYPYWVGESLMMRALGQIKLHFNKKLDDASVIEIMKYLATPEAQLEADSFAAQSTKLLNTLELLSKLGYNVELRIRYQNHAY